MKISKKERFELIKTAMLLDESVLDIRVHSTGTHSVITTSQQRHIRAVLEYVDLLIKELEDE